MSGPGFGAPGWFPDPSGRHELRWFDGASFTDQVADGGVTSTDAGPTTPPPGPAVAPPGLWTPEPAAPSGPPAQESQEPQETPPFGAPPTPPGDAGVPYAAPPAGEPQPQPPGQAPPWVPPFAPQPPAPGPTPPPGYAPPGYPPPPGGYQPQAGGYAPPWGAPAPPQPYQPPPYGGYAPPWQAPPPYQPEALTPAPPKKGSGAKIAMAIGAVGLLLIAGAVVLLVTTGDEGSSGFGEFSSEVDGSALGLHELTIPAGSVAVIQLDPDSADFDAIVGFAVDDDTAERLEQAFEGSALAPDAESTTVEARMGSGDVDEAGLGDSRLVFVSDLRFAGESELTFLPVPFDTEATVVVGGFEGSEGRYGVSIELVRLDGLDEDSDGDDILDAMDDADLPAPLADVVEELLD